VIAGTGVAMYATSERLVVYHVIPPTAAEIVYDGPGAPASNAARKMGKNGQKGYQPVSPPCHCTGGAWIKLVERG
jgi:hypothetical protein